MMSSLKNKYGLIYDTFVEYLFFTFVFFVLAFGRTFSIFSLSFRVFPVFVTEWFLFLTFPYAFLRLKNLRLLPKSFMIPFIAFILFGCVYLSSSLLKQNFLALRDIVVCVYPLFFFLTFDILINKPGNLRKLMICFLSADVLALIVGRFVLYNSVADDQEFLRLIFHSMRAHNLAITFGAALAFIFCSFGVLQRKKINEIFIYVWFSLNLYMLAVIGGRAIWLGTLLLMIFLGFAVGKRFVRFVLSCLPYVLFVGVIFVYLDFYAVRINTAYSIEAKAKDLASLSFRWITRDYADVRVAQPDQTHVDQKQEARPVEEVALEKLKETLLDKEDVKNGKFEEFIDREGQVIQPQASVYWRKIIWTQAIEFGLESPFWGRGFGVYPHYMVWDNSFEKRPQGIGVDSQVTPAHNHSITVFYKMGFLGLALFLIFNICAFFCGLSYARRCVRPDLRLVLLVTLALFFYWHVLASFFDVFSSPPSNIFLWIFMGTIFAIIHIDKKEAREEGAMKK